MTQRFGRQYWDQVWSGSGEGAQAAAMASSPPNPHLVREVAGLRPGTALDAGCGGGAEAIWLASTEWEVTAVDIAAEALAHATRRAAAADIGGRIDWRRADLSTWEPEARFDLVTTHYAHPSGPQLDFYERLAGWVAPGGTLFIVGHLHRGGDHHDGPGQSGHHHDGRHGHGAGGTGHHHAAEGPHHGGGHPPEEASVTAAEIAELLDPAQWRIVSSEEISREMRGPAGNAGTVHDVVVSAARRG